jgi:TorA maturation chaperone TorD
MLARGLKLPDNSLPVDHFGYELVLMGVLAERNPEDVPEFLETYLLSWAYHLLSLMKGATTSAFYKAIAELTELSLRAIQERLGLTPATLRFYR